jgi:hypothetical protein
MPSYKAKGEGLITYIDSLFELCRIHMLQNRYDDPQQLLGVFKSLHIKVRSASFIIQRV